MINQGRILSIPGIAGYERAIYREINNKITI
jgi:hypothetical protein